MTHFEYQTLGSLWLEVLLLIVCLAAWGYAVWSTRFQRPGVRIVVCTLRTMILTACYVLLHHPTWIHQESRPTETKIALLTDRSGSMQSLDGTDKSRYQRAIKSQSIFQSDEVKVDRYEFDQVAYGPIHHESSTLVVNGNKTDIYQSVTQLLNQTSDLKGMVLFSDGHDLGRITTMSLDETKAWLTRLDAPPINAVLVGEAQKGAEIAIHSLEAPAFSFVRAPLRIRATIMVREIDPPPAQIQLMEADKIVQVKDVQIDSQGFGTVDFEFYPETVGEHLYTVYVPPDTRESNQINNSQHILVQIGRDKISVLHIAGSITWDLNGLRSMFERNDQVDLTAFYIMRTREHVLHGIDGRNINPEEMALVPFPTEEIFDRQLYGFDVIIFQDFDAGNYFSDSYQARRLLTKIRNFIEQHHGGLIVVGGPRMAGGPSLGLSPLAECLPISPPTYRSPYRDESVTAKISKQSANHPLLQYFNTDENPINGYMEKVTLNPQAMPLLSAPDGTPLFATLEKGTGRVAFLNTSNSFQWLRGGLAEGKTGDTYYAFWDQLLRWSTQDPSLQQVKMIANKSTDRPLDLDVEILLRDRHFKPQPNAGVTVLLSGIGNESTYESRVVTSTSGQAQAKMSVVAPGYYSLSLVEKPWAEMCQRQIVFLGGSQDEFRNQEPVAETLERLASLSGGSFSTHADLTLDDMRWQANDEKQITEVRRLKLRNWIWNLPILMIIAGLEWYLRRSSHLA